MHLLKNESLLVKESLLKLFKNLKGTFIVGARCNINRLDLALSEDLHSL